MAHGANRLSARQVAAATAPGFYSDGAGGLFLRVSANGGKRWLLRYRLPGGRRREMGLGAAGAGGVPLKLARERAAEARALVQRGTDPVEEAARRREATGRAQAAEAMAATFGRYAEAFLAIKLATLGNAKHRAQWRATLETLAAPIWERRIEDIGRVDVLALLQPIWESKHETAVRFRGRLEKVFDYAIQNGGYAGDNPARWENFNHTLPARSRRAGRRHQPSMPRRDLPAFVAALRARQAAGMAALALEFLILGAARSGEVRLARWGEIDLAARRWDIPADRMKAKAAHTVVLPARMVAVLEEARRRHLAAAGHAPDADPAPERLVFPGAKPGRPLSDMTLRAVLHRMGLGHYTVHGFRSTFRDWAGSETAFPRELAEDALAHTLPDVERSYRREQAVERRRDMMAAWQAFCEGRAPETGGNVTPLHAPDAAGGGAGA